ncbi:LOW QUALITY PROTEIN: probable WRKY transcription factor 27 [Neltuma alba]|uniref:LOW QUALITY PROTEIN: probable WRKY transcription factor 27 n=1 Tax=Neltuma alba TaxID=207710 RepID=UPI0010A58D81|nr:LOW QUALITY PROTEIN: probable WRKY transcription factor 27 [Prosopis alba]
MAEGWDLSAVVRGCRSSSPSSATAAASTTTTSITTPSSSSSKDLSLPLIKEENDIFSFPSLTQQNQWIHPFIPTTTKTTTISTSGCGIYPNSSFTDFAGEGSSSCTNNNNIDTASSSSSSLVASGSYASHIRPHFMPQASPASTSSSSGFQRFHDQHVQQLQQHSNSNQLQLVHQKQQFQKPPNQISGAIRSRKRKSQQKRMVCHVTAENLTADSWAWRKYGQKPIKGSPYPRNYYRCSSSKGCGARKQVERSNTEPDMFIVAYTGEHTHPRPTHRNSLAGSTRNKPSTTTRQPASHESGSPSTIANRASSSSQLSPTTPLMAVATKDECADEPMLSNEATSPFPEDEFDLASHDDILIPNMAAMMDKFLLGAGELHSAIGLSGGGGTSTSGNSVDGSHQNVEPGLAPNLQQQFSPLSRSSPG